MRATWVLSVVAAVGLLGGCGSSSETTSSCQSKLGVTVCVVGQGAARNVTAKGLRPDSQLQISISPSANPQSLPVGSSGNFPTAGQEPLGIVVPSKQTVVILATGRSRSDANVSFTFRIRNG